MRSDEIITLARKYHDKLSADFDPNHLPEEFMSLVKEYHPTDRRLWLEHACFMSQQIPCFYLQTKAVDYKLREKINRWLASLQTILWFTGVSSLYEAKTDNMNPGATFNREI